MKKILVAARHPGAANALTPVIKNLRSSGHEVTVIGVDNRGADKALGGSYAEFQKAGITDALDVRRDFEYGSNLVEMPILDSPFEHLVIKSDVVLVGTSKDVKGKDLGIEEAMIATSHFYGKSSVQLVDSWGSWYPKTLNYGGLFVPGVHAVMDELSKRILINGGAEDFAIKVTGQPAFDAKASLTLRRDEVRGKLGLNEAERLILYAGQVTPDNPQTLDWVVSNLQDGDRLVFSRHPRDERAYDSILSKAGYRELKTTLKTDEVMHGADIHVTHFSTTGMDSVLLGIPSINLMLDKDETEVRKLAGGYPLAVMGLSYEANDVASYKKALEIAPSTRSGLRERAREALKIDGKATQRVTDLVLNL